MFMSKDDRSPLNPFTGKKHYDKVNDDEFLEECYNSYYNEASQYQLLDDTPDGQAVIEIVRNLVFTVEDFLEKIGRIDYVAGYYDWEVHLVNSSIANACCYPGGKILVYYGIVDYIEDINELAFILGHEIAHALLDHSRTEASSEKTKNTLSSATWMGSFALDMMGLGGVGDLTRAAVNVAGLTSEYLLTKPWGRDQELEADKLGLIIAYLAGYDVSVAPTFWERFTQEDGNEYDFFSTHPADDKRIAVIRETLFEVYENPDFYSRPLLPETPKARNEFKTRNMVQNFRQPNKPNNFVQRTCKNCGSAVSDESNFCPNCGGNLNECPSCGTDNPSDALYCSNCGKKL